MTDKEAHTSRPVLSNPDVERAYWFLGSLVKVPLASDETGGTLAILEHNGPNGYSAPMHRHLRDDETFLVLDGSIHVVADGEAYVATAGSALFLPKRSLHGFVVTSAGAHFMTLHTPGGFDEFTAEAGTPAEGEFAPTTGARPPVPTHAELTEIALSYGIEIVGPPPALP